MRLKAQNCVAIGLLISAVQFGGIDAAHAQVSTPQINPAPPEQNVDSNNVDLVAGAIRVNDVLLTGGDSKRPMTLALRLSAPTDSGVFSQGLVGCATCVAGFSTGALSILGNATLIIRAIIP